MRATAASDPVSAYFQDLKVLVRTELAKLPQAKDAPPNGFEFNPDITRIANKLINRVHHRRGLSDAAAIEIFDKLYRNQKEMLLRGSSGKNHMLRSMAHYEQFLSEYPLGPSWHSTLADAVKRSEKDQKRRNQWHIYATKGEPVTCEGAHLIGVLMQDASHEEMEGAVIAPSYTVTDYKTNNEDSCWCGRIYVRRPNVLLLSGPHQIEYNITHVWR